jgi:hypothetical protein
MFSRRLAASLLGTAVTGVVLTLVACSDATQVSAPSDATASSRAASPLSSQAAPPPGHGLISGIPTTCDNNSTLYVTIVPGGPPGSGPAWFDDGTHTVAQHVTLVYDGQIVYEKDYGKRTNGTTVTCSGPFPWNDDVATITVQATVQP